MSGVRHFPEDGVPPLQSLQGLRISDSLFEDVVLHIARLTDREQVSGRDTLTLRRLPALVQGTTIYADVKDKLEVVLQASKFASDWRHRYVAHRDLQLALGQGVKPLEPATRDGVRAAVEAVAELLNTVDVHYCAGPVAYGIGGYLGDADTLVYFLIKGAAAQSAELKPDN